jgi:hypothetical protein
MEVPDTFWIPSAGMTMIQVNSAELKISGTQADNWTYAVSRPLMKLEPGLKYRLEGWLKVESLSDNDVAPMFKMVAINSDGKHIGDWPTFAYSTAMINKWQKLWVEITADDRFDSGYIAVDKGATNRPMTAVLYIKDVNLGMKPKDHIMKNTQTTTRKSLASESRFNDVFWPYKKSAVIGWIPGTIGDYKDYGVTFVSWGRHPSPEAVSVAEYCRAIEDARKAGTQIGADIGFKTNFAGFIKSNKDEAISAAQAKDIKGRPFIVDEMSNFRVKGYPAYRFTMNSPAYRQYHEANAERAMQCRPYGLMIDDVIGDAGMVLWAEGEYSDNSVAAFRNYLRSKYSPDDLINNDIPDITTFDIRKRHQDYMNVPRERRPFREELIDFQLVTSSEALKAIRSKSIESLGRRIPVGANLSPASPWGGWFFPELDYFSFECHMRANTGKPNNGESLLAYKMADALKRPAVAMGTGADHAFIQDNHLPGMFRYWIAEAYAFGNYFMAPYHLWAYSSSKGSYSYRPLSNKELAPLTQFIRNHEYLFDNYEVVARTALVLSFAGYVQGRMDAGGMVKYLANQNIPFEIVIAGDDNIGLQLSEIQLSGYDNLLVPSGSILSTNDAAVLQNMKINGKRLINSADQIDTSSRIVIKGCTGIMATLRVQKGDSGNPVVIHLLNSDYDMKTDSYKYKRDLVAVVPVKLLKNPDIRQVKLVRPPSWASDRSSELIYYQDTNLDFSNSGTAIEIRIPLIDIWGILELS